MIKRLKKIKDNFSGQIELVIAVSIGIFLTIISSVFSVHLYRDSASVYSFMARALANNNFQDAFDPAIPSLNVLLSWPLTLTGLSPERSLLFISCLFYVLTIVALHYLLKVFLPEKLAGAGAFLFATAPGVIRFSCTSLIDSGKTFFLVSAIYFLYKFIESKFLSFKYAGLLGVMLGGLALVRSEGIGVVAVIAFCLLCYYLYEAVRQKKLPSILPLSTLLAVFSILIFSRMYLMYLNCGKFVFDSRISDGIKGIVHRFTGCGSVAEIVPEAKLPSVAWAEMLKDSIRGSYELYLFFAVIGLVLFILVANWKNSAKLFPDRKIPEFMKWNNFYYVLIAVVAGNFLIFKMPSFVAYRYFLLNIPLLMVFTLSAVYLIWRWCMVRISTRFIFYALLLVMTIIQIGNGLKNVFSKYSRKEYSSGLYLAGRLNAPHNTERVWFIDKAVVEWYYSGMRRAVPMQVVKPDVNTYTGFEYILCKKDCDELQIIEKRKDLKEISLLPSSTVKLFQRIK